MSESGKLVVEYSNIHNMLLYDIYHTNSVFSEKTWIELNKLNESLSRKISTEPKQLSLENKDCFRLNWIMTFFYQFTI